MFFILLVFRPRIKISSSIAYQTDPFDTAGRTAYNIKVINRSLFSAFDMKVEVSDKFSFPSPGGHLLNYRATPLTLVKDHYPYVAPFRPTFAWPKYSDYALRFRTYDNWNAILSQTTHTIEVRIICRHALTGLGSVFLKEFTIHDLKAGTFKSGNTFDIV